MIDQVVISQKSTTTPGGPKSSKITFTGKGVVVDAEGKEVDLADIPETQLKGPGIIRLLNYNKPELHLLLLGVLLSIIVGCTFPAFAFILAELVRGRGVGGLKIGQAGINGCFGVAGCGS